MSRIAAAIAALSHALLGPLASAQLPDAEAAAILVTVPETASEEERAAWQTGTESERFNTWLGWQWDSETARSPIRQTYLGIKTDYDKWDDVSPEARLEAMTAKRQAVATMKSVFDHDALDAQAKLSWEMMEYQLQRSEADWRFRDHGYTFNQMFGVQSQVPAFLINQHRVATVSDAQAYVTRLEGVGPYLGQHMANAERAAGQGVLPPRFVYDYLIPTAQNVITGYPFGDAGEDTPSPIWEDFAGKVDALVVQGEASEEEAAALKAAGREAMRAYFGPAYALLVSFLHQQAHEASQDDGVWRLPDGEAYYATRLAAQTTTDMTADEIHALGLAEVARIHGEMSAIMETVGFDGTLADFFAFMRTDPQFYKPNSDEGRAEYLAEARAMIDGMRERLPEMFNTFPKADILVKRVEPFREKAAGKAFYQRPSADGSRPGIYYANLYDMADMPIYQMEALAFHEGIPGHHMQLAIAQELEGIPMFRKSGNVTAYTEGWGLYSEYFPKEYGFYADPYSDFGRLAMELWRAARLVVDTGLHHKRWTREEAVQYLLENTPNSEGDARKAIDRYIVLPGQATAYKIGMIQILALRDRAREALGEAFDIRAFHDVILKSGPLPLTILEREVDTWIARTKAG